MVSLQRLNNTSKGPSCIAKVLLSLPKPDLSAGDRRKSTKIVRKLNLVFTTMVNYFVDINRK
ncbi:uncharacterized protein PHALS_14680 [Plasmopara halstedii]|uniref:Uncharacterized protein n=1 Tax=Plasmopara halstedii TaxID=4781 RepID=A0A0P1APS6_PLAHL|nr:uncharacterized protein PHALS_14680 [Plasmopara halstedii]CEG43047.1 hypothetical protein PHALS_14680 [Plasmopara halstedii]|eukprot:XP_024579416.1 hypothetical protein PHALS_14680 [Plasmopara halstedii]